MELRCKVCSAKAQLIYIKSEQYVRWKNDLPKWMAIYEYSCSCCGLKIKLNTKEVDIHKFKKDNALQVQKKLIEFGEIGIKTDGVQCGDCHNYYDDEEQYMKHKCRGLLCKN